MPFAERVQEESIHDRDVELPLAHVEILEKNLQGHQVVRLQSTKEYTAIQTLNALLRKERAFPWATSWFHSMDERDHYCGSHSLDPHKVYHVAIVPIMALTKRSTNIKLGDLIAAGCHKYKRNGYKRIRAGIIPALCTDEVRDLMIKSDLTCIRGTHKPLSEKMLSLTTKFSGQQWFGVYDGAGTGVYLNSLISADGPIALAFECPDPGS